MTEALLQVTGVTAGYGHLQVLWGVDLDVRERETVVVVGPNGAGKSTTLKCLLGLVAARSGDIVFRGETITRWNVRRRVQLGLSYMSELGVFPELTIAENLDLGALFVDRRAARRRLAELYELFPVLAERRSESAGGLSGGQRKMLGIAKAMAAQPRLLVMDEPSAGLSPLLVANVIAALDGLRRDGLAMLIAEQNVSFLELGDRVFTMEDGRVGARGTPAEVAADDGLRRAYFGLGV